MRNLYLVIATTFLLAACGGGSGGETPSPDTISPVVTAPSAATFAAVDAAGAPATSDAIATFLQGASATDDVDGSVSVTNDAPDTFPLGDTTVTFSASDAAGNTATATAVATVTDQTAPTLSIPADTSFVATAAVGIAASDAALVEFLAQATAADNVDTAITVSNDAPATFAIGDTTVVFTATDAAGNSVDLSAVVTVTGASQSGSAEKGPLFNATVFFDYDGDKELDANEPSTLTDIDGGYVLAETSDAPAAYSVVVSMNDETIDSISGESYASSGVQLEAVKGSKVITPMTTLYSFAVSDLAEGEELSVEAFAVALGLPDGLDINTYSAFAKDEAGGYVDVATASQVEAVAQSLMTALQIISESVVSISKTALKSDAGVSQSQAAAVAMRSLSKVIAATVVKNAEVGAVADKVDFANVDDIAEVNAEVLAGLSSTDANGLGALLQAAAVVSGVTVDTAAAQVTGSVVLSLSTKTIAAVSKAFADLSAESFGQVEASAVSLIKALAVAEITAAAEVVVAAVSVQQVANQAVVLTAGDVDVSAIITLDNEEALNATIASNIQEVEAYLVTRVAPVIESSGSFVAAENQTAVGTVVATDTAGDVLAYSVSGADASALNISNTGVLSFVSAPDFETKTLYEATVTVADSNGNAVSQAIAITITDANDSAPVITSSSSFSANENQSVIGAVVATSPSNAALTFTLSGTDAAALTISTDGVLGFVAVPDYEAKASYSATVVVSDGTNDTSSAITVSIVNLNDSVPVITSASAFAVAENSKSVGTITATDADLDILTYTLSGTDVGAFRLSSVGSLQFKTAPNFEVKSSYSVTVTVSDGVNSSNAAIAVTVTNVNDVAPVFTSAAAFSVAENQTSIGTVTATDVDSSSVTFSVSSTELAISSGGVLSFIAAADFETKSAYLVTVTATDGVNSTSQVIAVTVTDADEDAPVISSSPIFSAAENQTAIGTVVATDTGSVTFSISGAELLISSEGVISFVAAPDYEAKATYTATVTVTDSGSLATSQAITVAVTDVDDVAPVFTSAASFTALDSQANLGVVTATDVDSTSIIFSISGSELAISSTGVISFITASDFVADATYSATVTLSDGTNVATQDISVAVFLDFDGDGEANVTDTDDDNDGVADTDDAYPRDPSKSSDSDPGVDENTTISGRVIDGYIAGAVVFLDLNFDGELSINEPSATSGTDGLFQFALSDQELSCATYVPTVVNVPVGAIDEELGVVDKAFNLVLPPRFNSLTTASQLNVSPITSVVWQAFETELRSSLSDLNCATILANAEQRDNLAAVLERSIADVVSHYNISEAQLFEDFIENNNDELKAKAIKIVKGLKKSLEETLTIQAQYPNASWAKVNYYFFSSLDGDDLYPNAWYRDVELYDGDTIVKEVIKVSDDLSEEIRPILYEKTTVSSVGGFGVREEIGYESRGGDDSAYSCSYKEEVSISRGGVEYQLVNLGGESNVLGVDSCQLPDFTTQSSSRYVFYRSVGNGIDSGAQFTFFADNGEFPALNEWTNLVKGLSDLEADELVVYSDVLSGYVESLPYGFCESGDGGADLVTRSRSFMVSGDQITLNRSEDGTYERIITFSDGTSQTELSTIDSFPGWDNCFAPDYDVDGSPNSIDPDDDNDGVRDDVDAFPLDYSEQLDTDGDGIGNNTDKDDDNDGVEDNYDQYPLDAGNVIDSDGDGIVDREDVVPNDASSFKALRMDFSASSSLGLGSALSDESNAVAASIPQAIKSDRTLLKLIVDILVPKAWASDVTLSVLTNAITWDDQGSIVLDTILSSETLFVAEAAVTPDGHYLYLLTSNHIQRAISGLDPEVCSIYRVTLSDYSFDCLLTTEEGDIEPKSLQGTLQTDSSRSGMDFRADGAAVMKGFDWTRALPEGVPGGTNSTIAWFMSAKGELIPLSADDGFFAVGALWLNDDYFAVAEYPFSYSDDSLNRQNAGAERLAIYEANTLTRVKEVIAPNIWGPLVKVNGDLHWQYGGSLNGESMEVQQSIVEGIPFNDLTGTRLFGLTDYLGVDNTLTSSDGSIVLPLSDGVATTYNYRRGSGIGTDINYTIIAFSQDYIAYVKAYGPSTPIVAIDGQAPSGTLTLSGGRGEMTINGHQFFFAPDESVDTDLVIAYQVDVNGNTESRDLTISAATIANWRADTSRPSVDSGARIEDAGLKWASPEPDEEGICVYNYSANTSTCAQFDGYEVLSTDMESFRSTRYDDKAVYPNGNGNAHPGISNVFVIDNQLRVFFKDSSDHSYYQAQVDVNTFFADGVDAFSYTPAINGAGEQNIISDATSLTPLPTLTLDNISLTTNDLLSYTIEFGRSLSAYAPLPYFSVSNEYNDIPLAREVEWSVERDSATITITGQGLLSDVDHKVEVLDPIFLANSVRRYELSEDLIFTPTGIDNFKLLGGSVELIDYNPLTEKYVTNSVSLLSSNGIISADMRDAPLNLLNIRNAEAGRDFNSPTLNFGIERLPVGEGSVSVTIDLKDGIDAVRDDNERRVFVEITANWVSDGVNATFTIPEQTIAAFYINRAGTRFDIEVDNIDSDVISISSNGANYPSTLNVKWLSALNKIDFLTPSALLTEGDYHVTVTTTLPMVDANNIEVTEINIIFSIAENNHFRLLSNIVQVIDYDPSTNGFTFTDVVLQSTGNVISADLRATPFNLENLENAVSGGGFYSPTLSFGLSQLAVGEGSFVLEIDLIDGEDSYQSDSERRVSAAIAVNWVSDGVSAIFSVPAQTVNLTYVNRGGTRFDMQMINLDADVLSVTSGGANYPDSLNMKLLSFLSKIDFVLPSSLLSEGDFYLNVTTDIPLTNSVNESITDLRVWFSVARDDGNGDVDGDGV